MLRIRVLGELAADEDGRAIDPPTSRRAWALLGYLALHPGAHPRSAIASAFWPDVLDSSARASMRSALWALRRALGPIADDALDTARDRLALRGDVWVDAAAFEGALREGRAADAVALCRGDLLSGLEDDWALQARDAHRARLLGALDDLAGAAAAAGDHDTAVGWARRAQALDPLSEEAARLLMRRLAAAEDRAGALTAYARLQVRLARELRTAPSRATRALADELRGAPEPERAARVPTPARAGPSVPEPAGLRPGPRPARLVGRESEVAALALAWAGARGGVHGGAVALVTGEAGIGKSRLVAGLAASARGDGGLVATCAAPDVGDAPPFGLWAELLGELLRAADPPPDDAGWVRPLSLLLPRLGVPVSLPDAAPDLARARLLEAAVDALAWAAEQAPLLLVMEDIHAADPSSLALIAHVTRRLADLPVLVVLTRRPRPVRGDVAALEQALRDRALLATELSLAPLPEAAVAQIARGTGAPEAAAVAAVVAVADGNPLLATEAARALARGEPSLPAGLRGTVRAAAATLPPTARRLLDTVAVAGESLASRDAASLLGDPAAFADALAAGQDAGLLDADAEVPRFRHALLREAVYAEIPRSARRALHLALAARLDAGDHRRAGEIARHLRLAGRPAEAVAQLRRAAAHARSVAALEEASALLDQAAALAPEDPDIALERADVAAWRHRGREAVAAFGPALAALEARGDPLAVARAHVRFADWHHVPMCMPRVANDAYRRALTVMDGNGLRDADERHEIYAALAWTESIAGDLDEAERMIAELDALGNRGEQLLFLCDRARSLALIRRGRFAESYAPGRAAGEAAVRLGRHDLAYSCWINVAGAAVCVGDLALAIEVVDRALSEVRGRGLLAIEADLLQARAWILGCAGARAEAEEALRGARRLADRLDAADLRTTLDFDRGRLALQNGDHAAAEELLAMALSGEGLFSRPLARIWRAEALARLGRCGDAEAELRATTAEPVTPGDWPDTLVARMAQVQGLVARHRGDVPLATRRFEEAARIWRGRLDRPDGAAKAGERWAAALTDIGRPVVGTVEPQIELDAVLADLATTTLTTTERT